MCRINSFGGILVLCATSKMLLTCKSISQWVKMLGGGRCVLKTNSFMNVERIAIVNATLYADNFIRQSWLLWESECFLCLPLVTLLFSILFLSFLSHSFTSLPLPNLPYSGFTCLRIIGTMCEIDSIVSEALCVAAPRAYKVEKQCFVQSKLLWCWLMHTHNTME